MRHSKILCIIVLCTITLLSCRPSKDVKHYNDFQEKSLLSSQSITVPAPLWYPRGMFVCNRSLVVLNEKVDTLFQVYSLPDLSYQCSFGIKGEGPDDFQMPAIQALAHDGQGFTLLDLTQLKHISFEKGIPVIRSEKLPFDFSYYNGMVKLSESLYCCDAGFEEEKEFMFLRPGSAPQLWGDYPEGVERFKETLARNQAYGKVAVAKPDGEKFAAFYRSIRRYRIYDTEGVLQTDVILDMEPGNKQPDLDGESNYIHTISAFATDNYIYTLDLDMTPKEIMEQKRMPVIRTYTWDGVPAKQYQLDRFVSSFTVDEPNKTIYATFVEDESHIYKFQL